MINTYYIQHKYSGVKNCNVKSGGEKKKQRTICDVLWHCIT